MSFARVLARATGRATPRSLLSGLVPQGGRLRPKLWSMLQSGVYSRADFSKDILAGLTVGVVAMPSALAS